MGDNIGSVAVVMRPIRFQWVGVWTSIWSLVNTCITDHSSDVWKFRLPPDLLEHNYCVTWGVSVPQCWTVIIRGVRELLIRLPVNKYPVVVYNSSQTSRKGVCALASVLQKWFIHEVFKMTELRRIKRTDIFHAGNETRAHRPTILSSRNNSCFFHI
jgi:hypothetical protein